MGKGYESVDEWQTRVLKEFEAEFERRSQTAAVTAPAIQGRRTLRGLWVLVMRAVCQWYKLGDESIGAKS